jgi:chromosome segregation ATPase
MVETRGDELGLQILRAVQELGTRMERVEAQVNHLSTRMDRLEARMERVEAQVNHLSTRVDGLSARMDKQEKWMERLAAEFLHFREQVRGDIRQWRVELQEDHRRLKKRLDATATTVVLMASVLRGPTEFSVELEANLSELRAG